MAGRLSRRVSDLECAISLLGHMHDRLRFMRPSMRALLEDLCATPRFGELAFPGRCQELMEDGGSFALCWRQAVGESKEFFGAEELAILTGLGDVLGSTDLDSQLAALACARELLETRLGEARDYKNKHTRLYHTLGILSGVAVVILIS